MNENKLMSTKTTTTTEQNKLSPWKNLPTFVEKK